MNGDNRKGQPQQTTQRGRPTDDKLREKGYTQKQIKSLSRRWTEKQNPRLF